MRDLAEMGLNLENCELWFERAVLAFMMIMVVLIVVRVCTKSFYVANPGTTLKKSIFIFKVAFLDRTYKLLHLSFTEPTHHPSYAYGIALAVHG